MNTANDAEEDQSPVVVRIGGLALYLHQMTWPPRGPAKQGPVHGPWPDKYAFEFVLGTNPKG